MPGIAVSTVLSYVRRYLNDIVGDTLPSFGDQETPTGLINGSNTVFVIAVTPSPGASAEVFLDGQLMTQGADYTLAVGTITFVTPPPTGSILRVSYRY